MNKLAKLVADGEINVDELASASDLIERAQLVIKGIDACKKTLTFPLGVDSIECYSYMDSAGEYESWGSCTNDGVFECYCNWGGNHMTGRVDLTSFKEVFMAFEENDFAHDLRRFLKQQIAKVE